MTHKFKGEKPFHGAGRCFETLIELLRYVGDKTVKRGDVMRLVYQQYEHTKGDRRRTEPGTVEYVRNLGLWQVQDGLVRLKPEGRQLIECGDRDSFAAKRKVLEIKLRKIAGYNQLLTLLKDEKQLSRDELHDQLQSAIRVVWKTQSQTIRRLDWLEGLGFVERDGKKYHLTPTGRDVAKDL